MRLSIFRPTQMLYSLSVRLFHFMCGQTWFQTLGTRRKRHADLLTLFLHETGFPAESHARIIRNALAINLIHDFWGGRLLDVAPLIVEGREHIEKAQTARRGIILARLHEKLSRGIDRSIMRDWLDQQTFRPLLTIGDRRHAHADNTEGILNAQEMVEAFRILRKGGVIQIAPDGLRGQQGIKIEFLRREREFRIGFAELSLATGAQVFPMHLNIEEDGKIVITIFPALPAPQGIAQDMQVLDLVNQFAAWMAKFWLAYPHMLFYSYMKEFMHLPKRRAD